MNDKNLCSTCIHKEVCVLKDTFERAEQAVNDCVVDLSKKEDGVGVISHLHDLDYIEQVKLRCKHFVAVPNTTLRHLKENRGKRTNDR